MGHQIHQTQSFFSAGAVVFQEDPTKPDFTNPSTNSISDTWNRWRTRTRSKNKLTAPICFNQKGALNKCRTIIISLLTNKKTTSLPPSLSFSKGQFWQYPYFEQGTWQHNFLYFYGLPSSLIDRAWLFNLTATPPRAGWLYDNGCSGIGWYFLVIQLDFPENREI